MKHIFIFSLALLVCGLCSVTAQTPTSLTFTYSGRIETWPVPLGVTSLVIEARGAEGGKLEVSDNSIASPGKGAIITGTISVTPGQPLKILVGKRGEASGGGGGTFITDINNKPLIISGGGGGCGDQYGNDEQTKQGQIGTSGGRGGGGGGAAGSNGRGGQIGNIQGAAGGGLLSDGENSDSGGGKAFVNGGGGGFFPPRYAGGFGGGGVGGIGNYGGRIDARNGGGGGGYSGGGSAGVSTGGGTGGGGGSFNAGTNQGNLSGANSGDGLVVISYLCSPFTASLSLINDGPLSCTKPSVNLTASSDAVGAVFDFSGPNVIGQPFSNTASASQPGQYTVTVINAGCPSSLAVASTTTIVSQADSQPITISHPVTSSVVCSGNNVSVPISVTGSVNSYQWYKGDNLLTNQTSATLTLSNVKNSDAGSYLLVVTGKCNSVTSTAISLTVTPPSMDYQALVDLYNSTNGDEWDRHDNWLTGCSPCNWWGVTCDEEGRVRRLTLNFNNLRGTLPTSLSALTNLESLGLFASRLHGPIPASLSALTRLQYLNLASNQFTGSIPTSLSALTSLHTIYFESNQLSGPIPDKLPASLQILSLSNNQLNGPIPASLSALPNLVRLRLLNNQLSGCFPVSLSALCGRDVAVWSNPGLPNQGNFDAFCVNGSGSDAFMPIATASLNPVCVGQSINLSVSAGTSYHWSGPGNFTANQQSPTFTPTSSAQSGPYSVTVGNGGGTCTSSASISLSITQPVATLTASGKLTCTQSQVRLMAGGGITYAFSGPDGPLLNSDNTATASRPGLYSVTVTSASGCSATATQLITEDKIPPPAPGLNSLTVTQGAPTVNLTASNCSGTLTWSGPNGTSGTGPIQQVTTSPGQFGYSIHCTVGNCTSVPTSLIITVQPYPVSVWHLDGDNNPTNSSIRPYLQLTNEGNSPIAYSQITVRYWLTAEDFSPLINNLSVYWAQLGTSFVKMRYVPLGQFPCQGAFGYIEYRFEPGAGSLAAKANSGPIQNGIGKNDWTSFLESNDYSYAVNSSYTKNPKITAYVGGQLVWGTEPPLIAPLSPSQSLKVYAESRNAASTNTISTYIQVKNEGNVPLAYQTLKTRYFFTTEGNQSLNFYLDYAQLGNSKVSGQIVRLPTSSLPVSASANAYLELSFTSMGQDSLYPASSTGNIQYRIAKSDWSNFNQSNDYSYPGMAPLVANSRMGVYLNGTRVFGSEPLGGSSRQGENEEGEARLSVRVLGNPVAGTTIELEVQGAQGTPLWLELINAQGHRIAERMIEQAKVIEHQSLSVAGQPPGVLFLRVSTPSQSQTIKVIQGQ